MLEHNLFVLNEYSSRRIDVDGMRRKAETVFGDDFRFIYIGGVHDYKDAIREAAESGEDVRIYACGGDGTLNSVAQEVIGHDNLSLTNIACGTGNDYLKRFDDIAPFYDILSFAEVRESKVDVIRLNDFYSVNVSCFGLDANVCDVYEKLRPIRFIGKFGYQLGCVVSILKGVSQRCKVELDDGFVHDDYVALVCICNNGWYGGSYNPAPEANVKDGLLDVIVCKKISRFTMVRIIGKYKKGRRNEIPTKYLEHHRVRSLRINPYGRAPFNIDGELISEDHADIEVLPGKLRFFYPASVNEIDP